MKQIQYILILLLLLATSISSQEPLNNELSYEVHRVYPDDSIEKEKLQEARTLSDLNKWYRPSWIRTYLSVDIFASHKGKIVKAESKNDTLSQKQKDIMNRADPGTVISVKVHYMPENTLSDKEPKDFNFTFTVDPEQEAKYPGGQQALKQYLKENIKDQISDAHFGEYQLAVVKFTIDEEGHVLDPHLSWTSEEESVDDLLLKAICNMPNWKPAAYANGRKAKQEFVLTVGDMRSCVVPTLNIHQD